MVEIDDCYHLINDDVNMRIESTDTDTGCDDSAF